MPKMPTTEPATKGELLDRDGFPPCAITVDEFCSQLRETFSHPDFRIVAFKVRGYAPSITITSKRGEMRGRRATTAQIQACSRSIKAGAKDGAAPKL